MGMVQYITELDGNILLLIQEFLRFEWLDPVVLFLTSLGNGGAVWIVLTACFLIWKKYQRTGMDMAFALLLGALITNVLLKNLVMRPRPYTMIPELHALVTASDWSFPSGHSTSSIAASFVMYRELPRSMGLPALILAVVICLSRLYVGVHYPSDVLCGAAVGLLSAVCVMYFTKHREAAQTE